MRTILLHTLLLALASGCGFLERAVEPGGDPPGVLTTNRGSYNPGEEVELTLYNRMDQRIGYNLCTSRLERLSGDTWEAVQEDRVCTMEIRTLEDGGTAEYALSLPGGASSGTYRYSATVHLMGSAGDGRTQTVTSNAFQVER